MFPLLNFQTDLNLSFTISGDKKDLEYDFVSTNKLHQKYRHCLSKYKTKISFLLLVLGTSRTKPEEFTRGWGENVKALSEGTLLQNVQAVFRKNHLPFSFRFRSEIDTGKVKPLYGALKGQGASGKINLRSFKHQQE